VLVEAATAGAPVAVHTSGLLAHLVHTYRLGLVLDCTDPAALAQGLETLTASVTPAAPPEALRGFADRYSRAAFERALQAAVPGLAPIRTGR